MMITPDLAIAAVALHRPGARPEGVDFPILSPGPDWTGTAASGFSSTPTDPTRTTAKPALRMVTPPLVTFGGSYREKTVVGAMAFANNGGTLIGGIDRVRFHFEGSTRDVLAPSYRTFTRRDGTTYAQLAYWVELSKPAGTEGEAHLYVEAIPADATMQNRVIGPYKYLLYDTEFTHEITLDPDSPAVTGENYQDFRTALNYLRSQSAQRSHILGYGSTHTLPTSDPIVYLGGQCCVIEWNEAVTIGKDAADKDNFRPLHSGLIFRGSNLTFDMRYISRFFNETGAHPPIFDKVRFIDSGGRYELWNKGQRPVFHLFSKTDSGGAWLVDCEFDNTSDTTLQEPNLVRGCKVTDAIKDVFNKASFLTNTITDDVDGNPLREEIDAITITGPAGATISLDGFNDSGERTFTAKEGGSSVGTFTVGTSAAYASAGTNYDVQDVADWINGLSGWSATVLDDTRRAAAIGLTGTVGGPFTDQDVSGGLTLITTFDIHGDWWQGTGDTENCIIMDNVGVNLVTQQMQMNIHDYKDIVFVNNAWTQKTGVVLNSNFDGNHSHIVAAHNSSPDQSLLIRTDIAYSGDAYCLFSANVFDPGSQYSAAVSSDEVVENNHYLAGGSVLTGETGGTVGGTRTDLFADLAASDFTPAGDLLTSLKPAVWTYDLNGKTRAASDAAGAVAV